LEPVINKIANLKPPEDKTQVQHLIALFGYWRIHIPYPQIIPQPLYKVTRKASDFVWGEEQKLAFQTATKFISEFSQLYVIGPSNMVILDILFVNGYGNWLVFAKPPGCANRPVAFYCKRFSYSQENYSSFEKLTWTLYEALGTICLILRDQCIIIRSPLLLLDWIYMPGEQLVGTPTEPKILKWKWYLQEQFKNHRVSAKGQTPAWIEDIANAPIVTCPVTITPPRKVSPIGSWEIALWSPTQTNAWFTDGSSAVKGG
jgi:hypothetical protein